MVASFRTAALTASALVALMAAVPAWAEDNSAPTDDKSVFSQLSTEYADCFAYYTLERQCMPHEAPDDEITKIQDRIDKSGDLALSTGRQAGLDDESVGGRYIQSLEALMMPIQNDCEKFDDLRQRYDTSCRTLLEHPEQRTKEIMGAHE